MEHANAEVGSSNLPPRLTPSAGAASDFQAYNTLANGWGVINQPAPIVGPPTSATYGNFYGHSLVDWYLIRGF